MMRLFIFGLMVILTVSTVGLCATNYALNYDGSNDYVAVPNPIGDFTQFTIGYLNKSKSAAQAVDREI